MPAVKKFLIMRFSSIGDIVLTTPVIRCLRKAYPDALIHYLTKPGFKSILEVNPYLDKVIVLDKPLWKLAAELKAEGYDYVIDLHHNLRTRIVKTLIDAPSYAFDKLNYEKWMLVNARIDMLPDLHVVDRYLSTLAKLEVQNDGEGLDFFIPEDTTLPDKLPASYTAYAIGAQHATKRMPKEKIAALCSQIRFPVVLLGGKEDAETGAWIASQCGDHVLNLCGALSLNQSALVVKHAAYMVSHDTGLMHIASAFRKPLLSIWGNTVPAFGMYPYYGRTLNWHDTLSGVELSCRPCSKIGYTECPQKHFRCMNDQPIGKLAVLINNHNQLAS